MIEKCFVCLQPALQVCVHPDCQLPPFICNGPCVQGITNIMHSHNKKKKVISIVEYRKNIQEIKSKFKVQENQKDYFNSLRSKVIASEEHLKEKTNKVSEFVETFIEDISSYLKLNFNIEFQAIILKIQKSNNGQNLTGRQMRKLMQKQKALKINNLPAFQIMKSEFNQKLTKFIQSDIMQGFLLHKERKQKSDQLFSKGQKYENQNKFQQAFKLFQQSSLLYDFNFLIPIKIGYCLYHLQKYQQVQQYFKTSLKLNQKDITTLNNLGYLQYLKMNYGLAIQYYSKSIELNPNIQDTFKKRAQCYQKMGKQTLAINDYSSIHKLNSKNKDCIQKIKKILNIDK